MIDALYKLLTFLGVIVSVLFGVYNWGKKRQKQESESENLKNLVKGYEDKQRIQKQVQNASNDELNHIVSKWVRD